MVLRADSNSKFLFRFLIIALVLLGYGFYSLYDAVFTGPKHLKKAKEYWVASPEPGDDGVAQLVPRHSGEEWQKIAEKNHWPIGKPKTPQSAKGYTYFNYVMAFICIPFGFLPLIKYFKTNNTWIETDGKSLKSSWGAEFPFSAIDYVDKKRWERKGIAKIHYKDEATAKVFVLDDFKYLREPTDEILYVMEQELKDEQIQNGERELSPEEIKEVKRLQAQKKADLENIEE